MLEDVPYTYRTCTVTLENFILSHLPFYVLSREGVGRYAMYISVLGNREDLFRSNHYASTLREPGEHDIPEAYLAVLVGARHDLPDLRSLLTRELSFCFYGQCFVPLFPFRPAA